MQDKKLKFLSPAVVLQHKTKFGMQSFTSHIRALFVYV